MKEAAGDFEIGEWRLSAQGNELRRGGEVARLEPKAAEVLTLLARRAGEVVGREELLAAIWPGVVVGDDALTQAIIKLRKALGDDAQAPRYIETISKRGYRLIARVAAARPAASSARVGPKPRRRWYLVGAVASAIAMAGVAAWVALPHMPWPLGAEAPATSSLPTIAVLPLANLSGDPRRDYFSEGLTEDLINGLGRFSGVRVMSRNAVEGYKGKAPAPRTIRQELGARYLVTGSVRESGGRVRLSVELSDTERGAQLASETYEGEGGQLFDIQDRMVRHIVGALHVQVRGIEEKRVLARPAQSLEVHDLVLRARALLQRTERASNRDARALLARAREIAPDFHEIDAELGAAEFQRATEGYVENAQDAIQRGEEHLKRAVASPDPRVQARAHSHLAGMYSHRAQLEDALAHANRAIELNPSDSQALYWQGAALLFLGRIDEAIGVLEAGRRIDPYPAPGRAINLSLAYYMAGRHRDALAHVDTLLPRSPNNGTLHAMRAATLARAGSLDEARREAENVRRLDPLFDPDNFGARFQDARNTSHVREGLRMAGL